MIPVIVPPRMKTHMSRSALLLTTATGMAAALLGACAGAEIVIAEPEEPNLSVVDLLFNCGPDSLTIIREASL